MTENGVENADADLEKGQFCFLCGQQHRWEDCGQASDKGGDDDVSSSEQAPDEDNSVEKSISGDDI